jgi:hypothetical protein
MSRFRQEWDLIPAAAFVIAGVVYLAYVVLMGFIWLGGPIAEHEAIHPIVWGWFFVTAAVGVLMALYVLLVGYVWGDAKRRGMNAVLWVLLGIFIPNAIGIILYFILRDPVPLPCPSCEAPAGKDQAFCAACGTAVRRACPSCRHPVQQGWSHCPGCGAPIEARAPVAP